MNDINTSVLIIDDEQMVRDNIEEILLPRHHTIENQQINHAASILFDTPAPILAPLTSNIPLFKVDKAANGKEGLEKVKDSVVNNRPYAVIFLDMRMPGWDGLETAIQIRKYDNKAEIIFVTAFTDRSIEEIIEQAGQNVGYHCKPYASEEIIQLATKAVTDYSRLRNLENLIESIASIGLNSQQLTSLLKNILDQLAAAIGTDMAFLGKLQDDFTYEKVLSIGALEEKVNVEELLKRIREIKISPEEVVQLDEVVMARLNGYSVFAVLKKNGRLNTEKMYLLRLFVQNAAQAIRNAEMNEELLRKEKLSAVGRAIGMVMHDLRPAIGNIQLLTGIIRGEGYKSDWLDLIDGSARQASEIFEDFLDFIRETPVEKETVLVKQLLDSALRQIAPQDALYNVDIEIDAEDTLTIQGDQSKLKRAFINLINNALEALRSYKVSEPIIKITACKQADAVLMQVRDNGPGIPLSLLKTVFEPFVTKDKSKGTGLGLAIVKNYVAAHGGNITVRNDNGAVFDITL
jgi:two-component system NtrC family sensor kinase